MKDDAPSTIATSAGGLMRATKLPMQERESSAITKILQGNQPPSQSFLPLLLFYDMDQASGQKSASSTCATGQGQTSGKVDSGRSVSMAASSRIA